MTPLYFLLDDSNKNNIYIKRDDLIPVSFGGNKARKAINFFKEIDQGGFDCVVTYGSSSSNHCRIVSNMATSRNLPCYIIAPKESSLPTFNSKMMGLFGSHFTIVPVNEVHDTIERLLVRLKEEGKKPYFIAGVDMVILEHRLMWIAIKRLLYMSMNVKFILILFFWHQVRVQRKLGWFADN